MSAMVQHIFTVLAHSCALRMASFHSLSATPPPIEGSLTGGRGSLRGIPEGAAMLVPLFTVKKFVFSLKGFCVGTFIFFF